MRPLFPPPSPSLPVPPIYLSLSLSLVSLPRSPIPPPSLTFLFWGKDSRIFQELKQGHVGFEEIQLIGETPFPFPLAQVSALFL